MLLNLIRAVPEIILALMFAAAVGLGPFSGVLALALGAVGFMGKLYAEAIEAIDPHQVMAVSATGASRAQTFVFAVVPQALPLVASYSLLLFERDEDSSEDTRKRIVTGPAVSGPVQLTLPRAPAKFTASEENREERGKQMPEIGDKISCVRCGKGTMIWQLVRVPGAHFVDPYQPEGLEPEWSNAVPDYLAWVCNNPDCGCEDLREEPSPDGTPGAH